MSAGDATAHKFDAAAIDALGVRIAGLAIDSRKVKRGELFLAYPGQRSDGRAHIAQAIAAGASAVAWESTNFKWNPSWQVPNIGVVELRSHLGEIASRHFGHPSHDMWLAGVTGTNGKTSCSHWIAQSLTSLGRRTAVMGTLGSGFPGDLDATVNTTPDAISVQARLADLRAAGAFGCAMEVSSHGIDQGRVNCVEYDVALFTNLSRDHLDYHGTMEEYGAMKARLFRWPHLKHAVVNVDDPFGRELARSLDRSQVDVLGYGMGKGEIAGHRLDLSTRGLKLEISTPWGAAQLKSRLIGEFNATNLLGVLGVLMTADVSLKDAVEALANVEAVPGRLQMIRLSGAPLAVVDYAHTPDALEKVLLSLRQILSHEARLHCVFGCGGDRDPGKRPVMGEIATRLAHRVIVTSDNPRSEDPRTIIEQIVANAHANYEIEVDRRRAILAALQSAAPDDVVLIAGKGHETYQEIGLQRLPFDDAEVAREGMRRRAPGATHA
ncbi:MAG TPA: UDP-N-acetylmuramoyl-L-alanyl-D-glutamate--2,6-diaminopimelate ligase [Burkholderiales bacterium]|nr:UDP-N-acetylmuramoyl-L-alanyl-D-glutamate--2,6-diaminopimelate ligase [Burkholderiales bacterium]